MYLFRATNCTYFTRICFPKALNNRGFPFDIKISLLTKFRPVATRRHLTIPLAVLQHIEAINESISPVEFKLSLNKHINELRDGFESKYPVVALKPQRVTEAVQCLAPQSNVTQITLTEALDDFVESKNKENILESTVRQLAQRIKHFIKFTQHPNVNQTTTSSALLYRDLLLSEGRSHKTNKEYLAAISQFFKWCSLMNYIDKNPFIDIPNRNNDGTGAYSARMRWQTSELNLLIKSEGFKAKDKSFQWITLILLYQGLRPGEACQLYTDDIVERDGLLCIHVNDSKPQQRLKNASSNRVIPIHPTLLKFGFIDFVNSVKTKKSKPLFNCKPAGLLLTALDIHL